MSRDFLRKKNLRYENADDAEKSAHLLYLDSLRAEMSNIKGKRQVAMNSWHGKQVFIEEDKLGITLEDVSNNYTVHYTRKCIDNVLDVIFKKANVSYGDGELADKVYWYNIELSLAPGRWRQVTNDLRLSIELAQGVVAIFIIHSFQQSIGYDFIKRLINNPGKPQEISPAFIIDGGNAKQYLQKMGIDGVLYRLFIINTTRFSATLYKVCISCADVSEEDLRELRRYMQKFELIGWETRGIINMALLIPRLS